MSDTGYCPNCQGTVCTCLPQWGQVSGMAADQDQLSPLIRENVQLTAQLSEAVDALYRIDSNADFCSCVPCRENSVIASEVVARYDQTGEVSDE